MDFEEPGICKVTESNHYIVIINDTQLLNMTTMKIPTRQSIHHLEMSSVYFIDLIIYLLSVFYAVMAFDRGLYQCLCDKTKMSGRPDLKFGLNLYIP